MSGLNLTQLKRLVVEPTLEVLELGGEASVNLVTGTTLVESGGVYLKQVGTGPALGLWQMEPATEQDCWTNFLSFYAPLASKVHLFLAPFSTPNDRTRQLVWNLAYAAAMCRVRYKRASSELPAATDAAGLARYWKQVYNSSLGAGMVDAHHVELFQMAINA